MESNNQLWTPKREAAALAFMQRYEGTRHMQRRMKAGRGVDCIRLVFGAMQAAGIVPEFEWPQYLQGIGFAQPSNWLTGLILEVTYGDAIPMAQWEPQPGDLGIFKVGRNSNHVGMVLGGRFWHVTYTQPVHDCGIDTVRENLQEAIRIWQPGLRKPPIEIQTT